MADFFDFVFQNNMEEQVCLWVEPIAYWLEIPSGYEYKIITDDKGLQLEFNEDGMTITLHNRFGCKILFRKPESEWIEDIDTLDIQFS